MRVHSWKTTAVLAVAASLALVVGVASSQAATSTGGTRVDVGPGGSDLAKLPLTDRDLTDREKVNLAVVLRAYRVAEGNSLDVPAYVEGFTKDGVFNDMVAGRTYRGKAVGDVLTTMAGIYPDVHRDLRKITVDGDVVAVELSIQGTFTGTLPTPAGDLKGNGAKIDVPTADFWYLRNGKIEKFDCFVGFTAMYSQIGVTIDWEAAVGGR
ncbi:nuclear transport factor 2 family protein [Umezawaea tangerina]|uniref:SnoaL-like protein n=1 Tax=Umezawaea tangerina TaxID=84725 RepID=A0A2T0T7F7_9PSEU|nr:nuclear transport factor 2 family protein [Umezawaea tangerina]PRY41562.1 SnoaL-like protein [Umezawaea tangerina]